MRSTQQYAGLRPVRAALFAGTMLATGLFGFSAAAQGVPRPFTLQGVQVQGNVRIEAETIRIYSELVPGETVSPSELNDAVQAIYASGLFEDVQLQVAGNSVLIAVVENPIINVVAFEGNDLVDDETLDAAVDLRPRLAYNRADVEAASAQLIDAYRAVGRFDAQVNPVIIERADNRVDVVFEIFEGGVTEIDRITFVGNETFSDGDLRDVISSNQAGFLSTFFSDDTYDPGRVRLDEELLRQFYLENGFAEFVVESAVAELSPDREGFFLTFTVSEGPRYTFGELAVDSLIEGLIPQDFEGDITAEAGDGFDQRVIDDSIENILETARLQGFAFTDVVPRVMQDPEAQTVNVIFEVLQGDRVFVQRIDIEGNTQTLDRVIRREFDLVEGDAFNAASVRETADRLRGLGYFQDVAVNVSEGSAPDQAVIDVEVEEQLTGAVNFGLSFSSQSGVGGTVELSERNFLGRGQRVAVEFSTASDLNVYSFSFDEPSFLDRDVGVGFDVYVREEDLSTLTFNTNSIGFEPRVSFPVSDNGTVQLRYRISSDEIVTGTATTASAAILQDAGDATTSSIGATYVYDRRNSRAAPTDGYLFTTSVDLAGLGGDAQYLRATARGRGYLSFRNDSVVTFIEAEVGAMGGDDIRINDRFFLGGSSFRGFAAGGFGPRDRFVNGTTRNINSALGGNYYAVLRGQASFPIGLPESAGIFGGVFANVGSIWGLDRVTYTDAARPGGTFTVDDSLEIRSAVGVSIFWDSPIGGLRLDFANPIETIVGDETESFRLSGGRRF
ncbi:outer membrane protein assembly factor BamA [Pontivivens insulae]|uniref:Outer membrane protein assembly factor BamA n=1 Tax=Pontivivens insulae TaxID=1639689 RepID=A0A2R8AB44_9RHOB|nr:outer membrane protein assembly factor BamA [Pontivivens insulae]RED13213.1 Beta-barrel assembly machine subunit BamA [Pontivivens insulae]SPF29305.1 Outer membrane protein assembly factor BamA [Pontivivens insulae]